MTESRDGIGDRMKKQYEDRTRFALPRRTYTILRADGQAFHTLTRDCIKPRDPTVVRAMIKAAYALTSEAQGAAFCYFQSDEISVLLTDFERTSTEAWFDGNLQKLVSISASIISTSFNLSTPNVAGVARFDCRAFTIPDSVEVENYFIWRQQDATRNSIHALASTLFSHKELIGKNTDEMQEMLWQGHGVNWSELPADQKRGKPSFQPRPDGNSTSTFPSSQLIVSISAPAFLSVKCSYDNYESWRSRLADLRTRNAHPPRRRNDPTRQPCWLLLRGVGWRTARSLSPEDETHPSRNRRRGPSSSRLAGDDERPRPSLHSVSCHSI
jgi:tRNA(His) 5'-end guanylyltransferase